MLRISSLFLMVSLACTSLVGCASTSAAKKTSTSAAAETNAGAYSSPEDLYPPDAVDSLLVLLGPPNTDVAHESFLRGLQFLQAEQPQVAELFYKRALANSPRNRFLAFQLAEILAGQGATGEALRIAKAGERYPGDANSSEYHLIARLYRESAEIDSAKWYYRKAIDANEQNLRALIEYSIILEVQKEYTELARVFDLMLPLLNYPRPMVEKLLQLHRANGNDSGMVALLRQAYATHDVPDYARLLAELLVAQGKNAEAQEVIVTVLDRSPDDQESWKLLVRLQLMAGQLEEARRSQSRLYTLDTTEASVLQRLAMLEYDVGRFDSSAVHFRKLLRMDSTDHVAHFFLSHLAQIAGDSAQALKHIRTALAIKPMALPYRNQLGVIFYLSGDYVRAHQVFDSTLAIEKHSLPMHLKGSALVHQATRLAKKDSSDARILRTSAAFWFLQAHALDSGGVELLFDLAANYERLNNPDSAIIWFDRLLQLAPEHAPALNYLGYLLVDSRRDISRGARLIDSALVREPDNMAYLDSRGWALYRMGQYQEALAVMESIEARGMDDETLWEHMALICEALQYQERARGYWRQVLRLDPGNTNAKERLGTRP